METENLLENVLRVRRIALLVMTIHRNVILVMKDLDLSSIKILVKKQVIVHLVLQIVSLVK